jgi:putative ABC transport system substrate-binding protein
MLRLFCIIVILGLLLSGCAAQKSKVYRVGVLSGLDFVADITDGFKARMTELGYVEGKNIIYDVQKSNFDMDAYKKILKKFVDDKVDLIVVFPTEATMEAKAAVEGTDIPVVFTFALIEGMGIVESVQQPGGNITGVRFPGPDVALKRFEILRQLVPDAKRILVPFQKGYPIVNYQLEALRPVAEAAGITLLEAPVNDAAELEAQIQAFTGANQAPIDAILIIVEPLAVMPEPFTVMGKYAYEHKIPLGGALMSAGDYSAVFGVNVNNIEVGKQTAPLADKVLKGTRAGTIPVVSSETFLQINYKAAQQLGLEVPASLLEQADEVIR